MGIRDDIARKKIDGHVITVKGDKYTCGKFSMIGNRLYCQDFPLGIQLEDLIDLNRLLAWWTPIDIEKETIDDQNIKR